jgi:hypothetical protein
MYLEGIIYTKKHNCISESLQNSNRPISKEDKELGTKSR